MDSPPAAVVAISPSTGAAPSPASPLPAAGREQLPHVEHVFDASFHDSAVPLKHPANWVIETYEHKLSLLENADEAISPWSRCFSLC